MALAIPRGNHYNMRMRWFDALRRCISPVGCLAALMLVCAPPCQAVYKVQLTWAPGAGALISRPSLPAVLDLCARCLAEGTGIGMIAVTGDHDEPGDLQDSDVDMLANYVLPEQIIGRDSDPLRQRMNQSFERQVVDWLLVQQATLPDEVVQAATPPTVGASALQVAIAGLVRSDRVLRLMQSLVPSYVPPLPTGPVPLMQPSGPRAPRRVPPGPALPARPVPLVVDDATWERARLSVRNLRVRNLVRHLEANGWRFVRTSGSHQIFEHMNGGTVVVPGTGGQVLPCGTAACILRQTGLK